MNRLLLVAWVLCVWTAAPAMADEDDEGPSEADSMVPPAAASLPLVRSPAPDLGALVLEGDHLDQHIACGGRDVLIHGSNGRFRLTGGCRSLSLQGNKTIIEAELAPGARVLIGGASDRLDYVLTGPGAPPVLSVSGTDSMARRVERLGIITDAGRR